ncbi:hypothetical protein [Halorussus sp. MSC15.2]|uniref:hypothetical protein n=1 Tax=Halorussus sp. MSC15.2 TaxID=2283638 RepID=UPI0013D1525B|nr:hypothetical protein [Halorussus sp. MSC15.2]NEU56275.1 hypothetical protein [Halorussus sp. MSC15.2]
MTTDTNERELMGVEVLGFDVWLEPRAFLILILTILSFLEALAGDVLWRVLVGWAIWVILYSIRVARITEEYRRVAENTPTGLFETVDKPNTSFGAKR